MTGPRLEFAVTYHVEAPRAQPSAAVYAEVGQQVVLADRLGFEHAWFAEHHGHAHVGHVPHPMLFALHLAGRTERIRLGASVVCVNLHHPIDIAEQMAMIDVLSNGRVSTGVGSGSTGPEWASYGIAEPPADDRRRRFVEALDIMERAWTGEPFEWESPAYSLRSSGVLPRPVQRMQDALWIGANSPDSARLAGERGYGLQLSNLRTVPELRELIAAYRRGHAESSRLPGPPRIAASVPIFVAEDDARAEHGFAEALEILLREGRRGGLEPQSAPSSPRQAIERLRFVVGSPERALDEMLALRDELGCTTLNLRPRWAGLPPSAVEHSLRLVAERVRPRLERPS